ncbi:MAG: hypothetical protein O7E51_03195 [Acidobacteria bacterium]|nr:hypothetical protein [Acidobacteriota bacterium]
MRSKARPSTHFGVCIDNAGYPASLEVGKLYPVIPDPKAAQHGYIRVIDESGEDYGYSAKRFFVLEAPAALAKALSARRSTPVERTNRVLRPASRRKRVDGQRRTTKPTRG